MSDFIYLDYNATTPVDPEVAEAIGPWLGKRWGNPSSSHPLGRQARDAVEAARAEVAALVEASPEEIVFTSCATEANNWAIEGLARALAPAKRHLVTSAIEHPSVAEPCRRLQGAGWALSVAPVNAQGRVEVDAITALMREDTALVSLMHANNETGVLQPVERVATQARRRGILVHVDGAQSVGKVPVSVARLGVDLLTLAGHKFYAPKGIGALYVRRGTPLPPHWVGGGQERGLRPGTENVPYIVGLGRAAQLARRRLEEEGRRSRALRDRLHERLRQAIPGLILNGDPEYRLPGTLNLSFPGVQGRVLLARAQGVLASVGSACHSDGAAAGTLDAMGLEPERKEGAVRLSLGRFTTEEEVDRAADRLIDAWKSLCAEQEKSP